ncbi:MAG: O-antigen ligase family protein [Pseudomonadota bacterium]|nr:O-antigen ligase family protein [Pseudomonadota bacterium]
MAIFLIFVKLIISQSIDKLSLQFFIWLCLWTIVPFAFGWSYLDPIQNYKYIFIVWTYLLIALYFSNLITKDLLTYNKIVRFIVLFWVVVNLFLYINFLFGHELITSDNVNQFSGVYKNRNYLAVNGVFLLILFVSTIKKINLYEIIIICLIAFITLVTFSTKGVMGLLLIAIYYMLKMKITKSIILSFLVVLCVLVLYEYGILDRAIQQVLLLLNQDVEGSGHERKALISEGLRVCKENILIGIGVNNSGNYLFTDYRIGGTYSHNNYIEIMLNGGGVAFLLFYFPHLFILYKALKINRKYSVVKDVIILLIGMRLVMEPFMVTYYSLNSWFYSGIAFYLFFRYLKRATPNSQVH